jgi:RNA polymerase sigma factor (sigma-70 family)
VLQDVALKALRHWNRLRDLEHPKAYLRRMIVNEHLSWRRKWARLIPQAELREPGLTSGSHFTDQHADRAELVVELNRLPRQQRAVLVLRYFEGRPDVEIAELLGCSPSTVRSHIARALAALRIEMTVAEPDRSSEEGSHAH